MKPTAVLLLSLLAATGPAAWAQEAAPNCPQDAKPLSAEFATWTSRTPLAAAADSTKLADATLQVGRAVDAALKPASEVSFAAPPGKPGGKDSRGGLFRLVVDHAGTYRVALGGRSWVDLVAAGKPVDSAAHGHGPACSGMHKIVDFALVPGEYVLQLSADSAAATALMVAERR